MSVGKKRHLKTLILGRLFIRVGSAAKMDRTLVRRLALLGAKKRGCNAKLRFYHRSGAGIQLSNSGMTARVIDGFTRDEDLTVVCNRRLKLGETIRVMITAVGETEYVPGKVFFREGVTKCSPLETFGSAFEEIGFPEDLFVKSIYERELGSFTCYWREISEIKDSKSSALPIREGVVRSLHWKEDGGIYREHNGIEKGKIVNTKETNVYAYFILSSMVKEITIV